MQRMKEASSELAEQHDIITVRQYVVRHGWELYCMEPSLVECIPDLWRSAIMSPSFQSNGKMN